MKLRDIIRKDPKDLKLTLKSAKRQKKDAVGQDVNIKPDGEGDNAVRGFNDNEGYIQ